MRNCLIIFLLMFLTGCQIASDDAIARYFPPSLDAFEYSEKCPHVCWLGINPGVTTFEETNIILKSSDQIDQEWLEAYNGGTSAVWFSGKMRTNPCNIYIDFDNNIVRSITFGNIPFKVNDFVNIIGEPDSISISITRAAEATYLVYTIYYSRKKIGISSYTINQTGVNPADDITALLLNYDFNAVKPSSQMTGFQPWLGYGHLQDYFPGQEIPTLDSWAPTP